MVKLKLAAVLSAASEKDPSRNRLCRLLIFSSVTMWNPAANPSAAADITVSRLFMEHQKLPTISLEWNNWVLVTGRV